MKKRKILYLSAILLILGLISYHRIFFSPFQILNLNEISQNQQGICLAENRRLSEHELLNRGMSNYFRLLQKSEIPLDETRESFMPECEKEYCKVTQLNPYSIVDYIKLHENNPEIRRTTDTKEGWRKRISPQGVKLDVFTPSTVGSQVVFEHQKDNSFSLYITKLLRDHFYPTDCCQVNNLNYFINNGFSLKNMPTNWRSKGKGNYYLTIKYLSIYNEYGDGSETYLMYETLPLDNCGEVYLEGFSENENSDNPDITRSKNFRFWGSNFKGQDFIDTKCVALEKVENRYPFFNKYDVIRQNHQMYLCKDVLSINVFN